MTKTPGDTTLYELAEIACKNSDGRHRAWRDWEQLKERLRQIELLAKNTGSKDIEALARVAWLDLIYLPKDAP